MRLIRVMCTGRVDLSFVLRALSKGMDGVFIIGCNLGECNYTTHGNFHALGMALLCKKIMAHIGIDPERLRVEYMSSGDGIRFAEVMNEFSSKIKHLGPLGKGEGIEKGLLAQKLEAALAITPFIRLLERERLRVPLRTSEEYYKFFASADVNKIFKEFIVDKLAISQIMLLLREKPMPTGEIARRIGLTPSEVSRHMNSSSRQGLVSYDEGQKSYALA